MIKARAFRTTDKEWTCVLEGTMKYAVLFNGSSSNSANIAQDMADGLNKLKPFKARAVRNDNGGKVSWDTIIEDDVALANIKEFGKNGANAATDFAEEINKVIEGG